MEFLGLISGGKDSIYTLCKLIEDGNKLTGVLYIYDNTVTVDSYMFQTVGKEAIECLETVLNVPLIIYKAECKSLNTDIIYSITAEDEVEILYKAIEHAMTTLRFSAVSSGAILSNYQKNRVENVCKRLGLVALSPLFNLNQRDILVQMIEYGIDARIIKVCGNDLPREALGQDLIYLLDFYDKADCKYVNYCGEGGEYETFVVDCPIFNKKIKFGNVTSHVHPDEIGKLERTFILHINDVIILKK